MPRTTSRSKKKLTVGLLGLAETPAKNIEALLEDLIEGVDPVFVLPVTQAMYTGTIEAVVDFLDERGIKFEAITDGETLPRSLKSVVSLASRSDKATDIPTAIVNRLREGDEAKLLVLWDGELEDDGGALDAIEYAQEQGIEAFDLANGLDTFNFGDTESQDEGIAAEEEDPEPEAEPEPAPTARRRRAAKAAEEPVAAAEDDGYDEEPSTEDLPLYEEAVKFGVRQLRSMARDRQLASWRKIGELSKDQVIALLYPEETQEDGHQTTIEEQISAAVHAETSHVALPTALKSDAAVALGQMFYMLAREVATATVTETLARLHDDDGGDSAAA